MPIAEIIIKYVATHCRLAQKEYQRNCLIDEYLQNVTDLETLCGKADAVINNTETLSENPKENKNNSEILPIQQTQSNISNSTQLIRNNLKKTTSLPDEQLVFKFDCILQERATFEELMGALDANSANTRFILKISQLDLLCLGKSNIIKLLNKLDKSVSIRNLASSFDQTSSI